MGTRRRRMIVWCALGLLAPAGPAWAAGHGQGLAHMPDRNCPPTFDRLTIDEVRDAIDGILVSEPLEQLIAYLDNQIDLNGDNILCLRIGPPDFNPAHGGPRILGIDNVRR